MKKKKKKEKHKTQTDLNPICPVCCWVIPAAGCSQCQTFFPNGSISIVHWTLWLNLYYIWGLWLTEKLTAANIWLRKRALKSFLTPLVLWLLSVHRWNTDRLKLSSASDCLNSDERKIFQIELVDSPLSTLLASGHPSLPDHYYIRLRYDTVWY